MSTNLSDQPAVSAHTVAPRDEPTMRSIREQAAGRGLTAAPTAAPLLHALALVLCWAVLCMIGFHVDVAWVWVPVSLAIAFVMMGLAGAAHDCVHGTFSRSRIINTVAGTVLMLPAGAPFATYRQFHLFHHAHTLGEHDPEGPPADFTTRWHYVLYMLALGVGFLSLIWFDTLRSALGRPPQWARTRASRRALSVAWFPSAVFFAALVAGSWQSATVRHVWLYPWLLLLSPVLPFVLLSEHYAGKRSDGILGNTFTIGSNPVTRFVLFNINHHTAHHLVPRVPGGRLHELDRMIAPFERRTASGYLAFHRAVVMATPWHAATTAPDRLVQDHASSEH